jgi:hypothetical protein
VTCEDCMSVDVQAWHQKNYFVGRHIFNESWTCDGRPSGSVTVCIAKRSVGLSYKFKSSGDGSVVKQGVAVSWTACRYGGQRPWFRCPGVGSGACNRRVRRLYLANGGFACRHCHGLAYACQLETPLYRHTRRLQKLRKRLGGDADVWTLLPDRPKGMHRKTYMRLLNEAGREAKEVSKILTSLFD